MKITHSDHVNRFTERNQLKDLSGHLYSFLSEGTNCSPLEAEAIAHEITDRITLFVPDAVLPGKLIFSAVAMEEPAGKPIEKCKKVPVYLSLLDPCNEDMKEGVIQIRQARIARISEEAFIQGALLTEEDCSYILGSGIRTVRRDVKELRRTGKDVPLRGLIRDIGPTISHKVQIIEKYIAGTEIVDLVRSTKHSLESIERYLTNFGRVIFLHRRGMEEKEISFVTKTSVTLTNEYINIYKKQADDEFSQNRILELTAERYKKKVLQKITRRSL